jgi:glutathione S-transferase
VPALVFEEKALTENVAILQFLNTRFGKLLPSVTDEFQHSKQLADLCFCSSTLHPIVTRIRIPQMFSEPEHASVVKQKASAMLDSYFQLIEDRLAGQNWWYEETWSVMDAYLYWVFWRVEGADFEVSRFPNYLAHARRMEQRDSVKKAIAIEDEAQKVLESEGLKWTPPKVD